ncbi:MAG TPA: hypothetical protein ENN90_12350 [Mariniphaga anaerophila]|uniref:Uncharacterized protein n=1 Tax=Mariniphaga anaerophila TaxID=1484053 RepID=A0A831LMI9_9BACT|nr:hypothetical protein [Mariniphaga anaerophila]
MAKEERPINRNEPGKNPETIVPITFNPHKHHLEFLKKQIAIWKTKNRDEVQTELRCIGNNLIDLYCGKLTVNEIERQCIAFAEKENLTDAEKLAKWLAPAEFRKTELTDKSVWVIKQGLDSERFLHIHPAKYSPFCVRVRAATLKTVIALKIFAGENTSDTLHLSTVNHIRTKYLDLSPVKSLEKGKGISRLWTVFSQP